MNPYIILLIWLASAAICYFIARARHVKSTLFWEFIVVFLGPLAIPLIFLAKPSSSYVLQMNARTSHSQSD